MSYSDDMERQAEHIRRWQRGESPPPLKLTLGMTYVCNLRCRFCARRKSTPGADRMKASEELPERRLLEIVEEAEGLGVRTVSLSGGGEPFLRKKTLNVMRAVKRHGMSGGTTTNGLLINEGAAEEMVRIGWDRIGFSIDGSDAVAHDYLRDSAGAFDRTTRAVRILASWKKRLRSESPIIAVTSVLTNRTHDRLPQMVHLAHGLGAQLLTLTPLTVHHAEGEQLRLRQEHWPAFLESLEGAKEVAETCGIETNLSEVSDPRMVLDSNNMAENYLLQERGEASAGRKGHGQSGDVGVSAAPCFEPWTTFVIHPDGYVDPCEMTNHVSALGARTLSKVWYNDPKIRAIRESFLRQELPASCAKCCGPLVSSNIRIRALLRGEKQ